MGYIKTAIPVPEEKREFGKTAQVLANMYLFDFRAHPLLHWRFNDVPMLETAHSLTEHARAGKLQSPRSLSRYNTLLLTSQKQKLIHFYFCF